MFEVDEYVKIDKPFFKDGKISINVNTDKEKIEEDVDTLKHILYKLYKLFGRKIILVIDENGVELYQ